jgi:hypothetical protein
MCSKQSYHSFRKIGPWGGRWESVGLSASCFPDIIFDLQRYPTSSMTPEKAQGQKAQYACLLTI